MSITRQAIAAAIAIIASLGGTASASPASAGPASVAPPSAGPAWTSARPLPLPPLDQDGLTSLPSIACAADNYCAAVGDYTPRKGRRTLPYVSIEKDGAIGKIQPVDTTPLTGGGVGSHGLDPEASMAFVACPAAGSCTAVGSSLSFDFGDNPFALNEKNGIWHKAFPIQGLPELGDVHGAEPSALACASAGNCVAGGTFNNSFKGENTVPFLVSETNGIWGKAQAVRGAARSSRIEQGNIDSLSCPASGTCLAVGFYLTSVRIVNFAVLSHHGTWGKAEVIPGLTPTDSLAFAACAASGPCTVAGYGPGGIITVSESSGTWDPVQQIPNTAPVNTDTIAGLACPAAGTCSLIGWQAESNPGHRTPFIATMAKGNWAKASPVPGLARLDTGFSASLIRLSCGAAGSCAAAGFGNFPVTAHLTRKEAFVVSQSGGVWGHAEIVPGIVKLDGDGDSQFDAIACASANRCVAGGDYQHNFGVGSNLFITFEHTTR